MMSIFVRVILTSVTQEKEEDDGEVSVYISQQRKSPDYHESSRIGWDDTLPASCFSS